MNAMAERLLPWLHLVRQGRWRIQQPPDDARDRQEKDGDADGLVELVEALVLIHVPAKPDHEQDAGGDHPVKGNRHGAVAR